MHRIVQQPGKMLSRFSVIALLVLSFGTTGGELEKLNAAEIRQLLAGNTSVGNWDGRSYRQYFATDGTTIYAQKGSRSSLGKWRVDFDKHLYESWWENADWSGYGVSKQGDNYYWVTPGGTLPPQRFDVLPGNQLTE